MARAASLRVFYHVRARKPCDSSMEMKSAFLKYCRCVVVAVFHAPALESGRGWQRSGTGESGLYVANLFSLWASPTDATIRTSLRVSPLWPGDSSGPQWEPQYLSRRFVRLWTSRQRHSRSPRLVAVGSRHQRSRFVFRSRRSPPRLPRSPLRPPPLS